MTRQAEPCAVAACRKPAEKRRSFIFREVELHVSVCAGCDALLDALAKQPVEDELLRPRSLAEIIFG